MRHHDAVVILDIVMADMIATQCVFEGVRIWVEICVRVSRPEGTLRRGEGNAGGDVRAPSVWGYA